MRIHWLRAMRAMQLKLTSFPKAFASLPNNSFISVPTRSGAGFSMTGNRISQWPGQWLHWARQQWVDL